MFEVEVLLEDLDRNAARVELYADGINGGDPVHVDMKRATVDALRVSRKRTHHSASKRLHGASNTTGVRGSGSVGLGAYGDQLINAMTSATAPALAIGTPLSFNDWLIGAFRRSGSRAPRRSER